MKNTRILTVSILIVLAIAAAGLSLTKRENVITKDQIIDMFDKLPKSWDTSKPLLWGYFFTDSSREKLENVAPILEKQGYKFVNIHVSGKKNPGDPDLWWLHVEKVEAHNPDSLDKRNKQLYQFADEYGIDSYDGMDVGPAPAQY